MLALSIPAEAPPIEICLWNGELLVPAREAVARVLIKSRRALSEIVRNPSLGLARGYMEGWIEIQGALVPALCALLESNLAQTGHSLVSRLHERFAGNSEAQARRNALAHYDLGNDFFSLWLDETMTYSCGLFLSEEASLAEAQRRKCDLICRKLALASGERFLDVGCGWGFLALYAAKTYGVQSMGITHSPRQREYAASWAARDGVAPSCRFELLDYRRIEGVFDKIASVGMLEHVGRPFIGQYFRALAAALRDGGRLLVQVIGQLRPVPSSDFIHTVFPGGYIPTADQVLEQAARAGLICRHADNFAEHYILTLRRWRQSFEDARARVEALKGAAFARWWELYLAMSEAAFTVGQLQLFQFLFTKGPVRLPLDRSFVVF